MLIVAFSTDEKSQMLGGVSGGFLSSVRELLVILLDYSYSYIESSLITLL